MAANWHSYDSAATTHDRVAAASVFEPPAREMVSRMELPAGAAILDVGTGTGVAARMALERTGSKSLAVGLDPSLEMLRLARSRAVDRVVAGSVPGLPFREEQFDAVLANFVLSHVSDCGAALKDMARVVRAGGKLGMTAWTGGENEYRRLWQSVADRFIHPEELQAAVRKALPWEDWLMDERHLVQIFEEAGLASVSIHRSRHATSMLIRDFLEMRESSLHGRYMRQALDAGAWQAFKEELAGQFYGRYKDPIEHDREIHVAIGTKP